jgi:hypothetical protein
LLLLLESSISVRVVGSQSTLQAEAASFLQLLIDLHSRLLTPLLVFADSLELLRILQRWVRARFHPHPTDIEHFDVIFPLLEELRLWNGPLLLVKVKSHTGQMMQSAGIVQRRPRSALASGSTDPCMA